MTVGRTDHTAFASAPPPPAPHPDDVFLWPDGTYCTRADAHEYHHMSDDYRVIHVNTFEWTEFYI